MLWTDCKDLFITSHPPAAAISFRRSLLMDSALALPPTLPPLRPNAAITLDISSLLGPAVCSCGSVTCFARKCANWLTSVGLFFVAGLLTAFFAMLQAWHGCLS